MKISIIIPSYNQSLYLEKTIRSVVEQKYYDKEIIIIDGGSSDGSIDIIKKYEKYLTYWVSEKDKGQANAINKGIEKAKGDILYYVNSDDVLIEGTLNKVAKYFYIYKEYDLIAGHSKIINSDDMYLGEIFSISDNYIEMLIMGSSLTQPSVFFTRKCYENVGTFDESLFFSLDYEYWIRCLSKGFKLKLVNDFFSKVRIHKDSKSSKFVDTKNKEDNIIKQKYASVISKNIYKRGFWRIKRGIVRRLLYFISYI